VGKLYGSASARVSTAAGSSDPFRCVMAFCRETLVALSFSTTTWMTLLGAVACADTDAPTLWRLLIPLLLHADDIALLSHTPEGPSGHWTWHMLHLCALGIPFSP